MNVDYYSHLLEDEIATCAISQHLSCHIIEAGGVRLPVVRIPNLGALDALSRERLGMEGDSKSLTLVGGGAAQLLSFWVEQTSHEQRAGSDLARLWQTTVQSELDSGANVIAVSASTKSLAMLTAIPGVSSDVSPAASHFTMRTDGYASLAEYVDSQPAHVRKVWRRDVRDGERADLTFAVDALTGSGCADAAPFLAETARRYGDPADALTTEWRLASRLRRSGEHLLITIRSGEEVVAYVAVTVNRIHLDAHSVGVSPTSPFRQEAYQSLYRACAQLSIERQLSFVAFGYGNPHPKLSRGCTEQVRWRVDFSRELQRP